MHKTVCNMKKILSQLTQLKELISRFKSRHSILWYLQAKLQSLGVSRLMHALHTY